jgi:hypothetical protein
MGITPNLSHKKLESNIEPKLSNMRLKSAGESVLKKTTSRWRDSLLAALQKSYQAPNNIDQHEISNAPIENDSQFH